MTDSRPRYLPDRPFPPYSYVSGLHPHPISDPRGHSYRHAGLPDDEYSNSISAGAKPTALRGHANQGDSGASDDQPIAAFDPAGWRTNATYLYAIDLFNHGYYWEAHEAWEELWHACGRSGTTADFFKGLIHLAAAGVKAREHRPAGVVRHARRAQQLFEQVQQSRRTREESGETFCGLKLNALQQFAAQIAEQADTDNTDYSTRDAAAEPLAVKVVFTDCITLQLQR